MAYIRKKNRKSGIAYTAEVRLRGFPYYSQTFDRQSEAYEWGEAVEYSLKNNLPLPGEEYPRDDKSIEDAVSNYLCLMEKQTGRSRHTVLTDRGTGNRLIQRFGKLSLRTLVREDIEEYKQDRLNEVGPSSIRQDMSMINRIYETARIKWRMKDLENPGKDIPFPAPPPNRKKVIQEFHFEALLIECKASKNQLLYPLVFLLLNTGMRPEEAVLLRWNQVLFNEKVIDLTKTKTEPRRVPLSNDSLLWLIDFHKNKKGDERIFLSENNAKKDKPIRFFRRAFEQACIRAGINRPKKRDLTPKNGKKIKNLVTSPRVTFYTLRHSAATYMLMNGVDIRTVADILGHKNISQTMKYTHMADSHKLKAVNVPNLPWKLS